MKKITQLLILNIFIFCLISISASSVYSQQLFYSYQYRLDLTGATEPPKLGGMPDVDLPKAAINNGVEGTLKAVMTLARDGKLKDIKFEETLPHGVEETFRKAYKTFRFTPAKNNGVPIDSRLFVTYNISAIYNKRDKKAKAPNITEQPEAVYPPELLSEGRKDSVFVDVLFNKDGTVKVLSVNSSMPKAFDQAAVEAAKKIKFEPAVHKKSKKPVTMQMPVEYKFKP